MNACLVRLALAAMALILTSQPSWAGWMQDGDSLNFNQNENAYVAAMAFSKSEPYAAWVTWREMYGNTSNIYVKRLNGSSWDLVGGSLNMDGNRDARMPGIAVDNTTPHVVWTESTNSTNSYYQVNVKNYIGAAWASVGGNLNIYGNTGVAWRSDIQFNNITPYVSWYEFAAGVACKVIVKHWNGASWQQDGNYLNINENENATDPDLRMFNGTPYVAWTEGTIRQVYVKYFNGTDWQAVGGSLNNNTNADAQWPSLALNSSGTPYVSFLEASGTTLLACVKHYDGAGWAQDGSALNVNSNVNAQRPMLAFYNDVLYSSWAENAGTAGQIYAAVFNGSVWNLLGGSLNKVSTQDALSAYIAFMGNTLYLTWQEKDQTSAKYQIYVQHYLTPTPTATITQTATLTPTSTQTPPLLSPTPSSTESASTTATLTPLAGAGTSRWVITPNPFAPVRGQKAHFNCPQNSSYASLKIKIFNLKGRCVITLNDTLDWDGKNAQGMLCEGGVYACRIETENQHFSATVFLLR
jgi:hypothetical protein